MGRMARLLFLITLFSRLADAQAVSDSAGRGSISGIVVDSVVGIPLARAAVQLVAEDTSIRARTVLSDSLGRYTIDGLVDGRYVIGFFHPMLDSLGLEPPVREVFVRGAAERVDLSIPSPTRIRATICGPAAPGDSGAIVIGFARDARDGRPAPHVRITGEWHELSFTSSGIIRSTPRLASVSLNNGWFAMCGVPRGGTMGLIASRGEDSSGVVEVQIPANGFARRDLYIAWAPALATDTTVPAGAGTVARSVRRGDVRLHGTLRRAGSGEPIAGAQVVLAEGPYTTTDERGEWALVDAPAGTRMLEARAVGLYPERIAVDVVTGAPPIHISMHTLRAVLDTIKVRAVHLADLRSFEGRRRTGPGRFLGPRDVMRYPGRELSDILRMQPGVQVQRNPDGGTAIFIRGALCEADLYIDGNYMFTTSDVDAWVRPEHVAGIEIHGATMAPPQFQRPLSGCGAIVIWTK
jgi:hypothetical protein